ncbi:transcriptional regulator [Streptomyces yaizuensis]|uniref:ParB/RepB/Spo0J family partition protein n=1 Tax=Streptomyces yaizuensis TaxID=2989713 RepID=A0ABQ5NU33_9ACTN|nr:transcriptional regulator [Streptomyces sp. YSPA8]GLF93516.1 ParB/RepB/Spo0J family partition protein [Streptomyces sp. YSPA8]
MSNDYGRPPLADEIRALVGQRLEEAAGAGGVRETLTVEWRTQPLSVEVIDMPVDRLYYNPHSHRIRAQRSHDPQREAELKRDGWQPESQSYLHYLLQALPADPDKLDPEFDKLMESLRDFKQNEPGLITRDGVLVNGNTRRAALKELGVAHMRVGVLPESCTLEDINAVELSLQLRPDRRRDYSYINRLLAISEQQEQGRALADIARDFRIRESTCEQELWILSCLKDLIERSAQGGNRLRLLDFENHQEKLRELYRRYAKESAVSRDQADLLKENRLAAIVLNFSKTDVRLIEPDFRARYLDRNLPASLRTETGAVAAVVIPGLNRTVAAAAPAVAEARALTDTILQAKATENTDPGGLSEGARKASEILQQAHDAFEDALEPAGKDARIRKRKQAAPDRIADACKDLEQGITDLVLSRGSRSLDEETFDEAVVSLRHVLRKLAQESARSISAPGEGVSWLLEATRQEGA